jgi:hypothetical protein
VPGIGVGQPGVGSGGHLNGLLGEDRVEHLALVREPPVRGADADTGPCRDVVEGDVEPLLGEQLPGGRQQPPPVLRRITIASMGFFLITLDISIVNVALAQIRAELGGGTVGQQWIVDGYTLMFASLRCSPATCPTGSAPRSRCCWASPSSG